MDNGSPLNWKDFLLLAMKVKQNEVFKLLAPTSWERMQNPALPEM